MINLAGDVHADESILEELHLAGIPTEHALNHNAEVPYTYIGKFGDWTFVRAWTYWIVSTEEKGLTVDIAEGLYNKKHPIKKDILGNVIRARGDAGCTSPKNGSATPIYNLELFDKLIELEYEKKTSEWVDFDYFCDVSNGELAELCNSGKIDVERYVSNYHIDTQVGLNEFVKFLMENEK